MSKIKIIFCAAIVSCLSFAGTAQSAFSGGDPVSIKIDIYPNPATDFLMVDMSELASESVSFELRSMIGNSIRINPEKVGFDSYRIPIKEYATGYYFLIIQDDKARFKKAIKFLKH